MKTAKQKRYELICKTSDQVGERNDCTVRAIAMVCRVPYKEAHEACRSLGRKNGRGMLAGTVNDAARKLGFEVTPVKNLKQKNGSRFTPMTVGVKCKGGYYMVFVRGHVLPVVNGIVYDWTAGRRHRVTEVFKVTRKK